MRYALPTLLFAPVVLGGIIGRPGRTWAENFANSVRSAISLERRQSPEDVIFSILPVPSTWSNRTGPTAPTLPTPTATEPTSTRTTSTPRPTTTTDDDGTTTSTTPDPSTTSTPDEEPTGSTHRSTLVTTIPPTDGSGQPITRTTLIDAPDETGGPQPPNDNGNDDSNLPPEVQPGAAAAGALPMSLMSLVAVAIGVAAGAL